MSGVYKYETKGGTRWRIVFDGPADPTTGRRRQRQKRGFRRERDAKEALRELQTEIADGGVLDEHLLTLGAYLNDEWLPSIRPRSGASERRHRGTVSVTTHDRYTRDLTRYVIPRIGDVPLRRLTPATLDRLYDDLERAGGRGGRPLSPKTVANLHNLLHKALADAVKRGRLRRSPADGVAPPTATKARTRWWTIEELRAFLLHVTDDELYPAYLLLVTTGARLGEVAGLTWEDIDLDTGLLRIDWTLGHVGHRLTWKPRPKSKAGNRVMALDPASVTALRHHHARQQELRRLAGPAWKDSFADWQGLCRSGLVWTWGDGSPVHPRSIYERFVRRTAEAGLPRIRLHDVRHSYASAALASATGWHDVKVISQRLGHANVAITLDTYAHILPAADETLAHTLAEVILGGR